MFLKLANQAGKGLDQHRAIKLVAGVLVGVGSFAAGMASRNHRDFNKSPVPALTPDAFLARHAS